MIPGPANILLPCAVKCIQGGRGNDFRALVSKGKSGGGRHIQARRCIHKHGHTFIDSYGEFSPHLVKQAVKAGVGLWRPANQAVGIELTNLCVCVCVTVAG